MSAAGGRRLQPTGSTASFHLFIGVTLEFPYIPLLPVKLGAFLVTAYAVIVAPCRKHPVALGRLLGLLTFWGG